VAVPYSVRHTYAGEWNDLNPPKLATCSFFQPVSTESPLLSIETAGEVIYTYEIKWIDSDTPWSHRWDLYLKGAEDAGMHWWSIVNSAIVVLFLAGMIAIILVQALRRDIVAINNDDEEDETGWKLVHGDVFRPPSGLIGPMVLSVMVGSGVQLACMCAALMLFAVLGVLSPANRGALATALVVFFVIMGAFAGFVSSRIYKMFLGKLWARNAILTATVLPGTIAVIAFTLNMVLWSHGSTLALPFGTMLAIAAMWFFVSTPLVMTGAYFGFTRDAIEPPVRVSSFARVVSTQPLYMHPVITALVGGVLPFGAVFIELYFIMTSIWTAQPYYVFGFLALVLFILGVTCAEISIVMCYFQLCAEDHRWWWRSFLNSGASALYVFLYSIFYFATSLDITDPASATLYFGNMLMVSFAFFLLTGSMGFLSTLTFVRYIFSQIKVD
jgi:transmembrane 9 superfamily protein 2/4